MAMQVAETASAWTTLRLRTDEKALSMEESKISVVPCGALGLYGDCEVSWRRIGNHGFHGCGLLTLPSALR